MKPSPTIILSLLIAGSATTLAADPSAEAPPSLLAAPPNQARTHPPRNAGTDEAEYRRCMRLATTDPGAAKSLAAGWQAKGGGHPADHCFAVALIGLGRYRDAAGLLEKLAQAMVHAPTELRAEVLGQGAQAWLLAGEPGRAWAADEAALGLRPNDADLLVDQAEAAGAAGWFDKALGDLDRVLAADPARPDALIYRASAYRALSRLDDAASDIDKALVAAPDSVAALLERGNIRSLKGEFDGAREDWQRVAKSAPGSPAAEAAKANLARLDNPAR